MRKKIVILSLILVIFNLTFYYISIYNLNKELIRHNEKLADKFYMEYNTIVKDFYNLSDFIVDAYIYSDKQLLENLYSSIIEKKEIDKNRKDIFKKLYPILEKIREKGYSQIHLIDNSGHSFLRLHLPELYGDDLKPFRKLILEMLEEKRKILGLEVGRHEIAYRAIYPIIYKGEFLGMVDLALNSEFLLGYMNKELDGVYHLIINKSSAKSMKEEFFLKKYKKINPQSDFYISEATEKKELDELFDDIIKNEKIDLSTQKQRTFNFNNVSITFIPIFDVSKVFLGYIVKLEKDNFIKNVNMFRTINASLFALLSLITIVSFIIILRKNKYLQEELHKKDEFSKKLSELNRLYNIILENSDQIVYDYNMNTGKVVRSGSIEKILGIDTKNFSHTHVLEFYKLLHPEDKEKVVQITAISKEDNTKFNLRYRLKKSDGTYTYIQDQGVYLTIDGEKHILGTMKDITPIVKYEETLQQAQRLESIGILAGGIAHDFNNLLAGMWNYIEMIKLSKDPEMIDSCIEKARNGLERAKSLTNQLLTFSRGGAPNIRVIDIKNTIKTIVPFSLTGSGTKYHINIDENLANCLADEHQISQVIENILINARQAMSDRGEIFVEATNHEQLENNKDDIHLPKGRYVKISIRDTGPGIPEENLKKIFEPFFTTKKKGKGLGLSICYNIIKKHNGFISIKSEVGKGTTVDIYLPATNESVAKTDATFNQSIDNRLHIIVMDDEELILDSAKLMLEALGHVVYTCSKGEEAIEKYKDLKNNGITVDLFILDITVIGGMGGLDTINELLKYDKNIRAIVSSGYAEDQVFANFRSYGFCSALKKPYGLNDLSKALVECFNNS